MQARALDPVTGVPAIPAMTSDAERECYYRLAQELAQKGEIVEFGAWLGASTAYIAAGYRDGGGTGKVQVYDKFQSKKGHIRKVQEFYNKQGLDLAGVPVGDAYEHFRRNMGPLLEYVQAHKCQIETVKWGNAPIALIVNDAPKRVPAISAVLTNFRSGIREGTVMAWQDFCHFPSYEIPACLYRLREHFEFTEAVVPGSTLVFRVKSLWAPEEVSLRALSLKSWTFREANEAWDYWVDSEDQIFRRVPKEKQWLFLCGYCMLLCDIGETRHAVDNLKIALEYDDGAVVKKWRYLRKARPDFFIRYRPLFDCVGEERLAA